MKKRGLGGVTILIIVVVIVIIIAGYFLFVRSPDLSPKFQKFEKEKIGGGGSAVNQTHLECISNTCTVVSGAGSDGCSPQGSVCGNETIECYDNEDCPPITTTFCNVNGSACTSTQIFECMNPGEPSSECVVIGGGGGCSAQCPYGCLDGECLPGNETFPDLVVTSLYPLSGGCGVGSGGNVTCTINLALTVKNIGDGSAGFSYTNLLVDGPQLPPGGAFLYTQPLAPQQIAYLNHTIYNQLPGNYTATATADWFNDVIESNENNNILTTTFLV